MVQIFFVIGYLAGGLLGSWIGASWGVPGIWLGGFAGGLLVGGPCAAVGAGIDRLRGA